MSKPTTPSTTKIALVVDDVPSVRYYHTYILKRAGFHCEAASNGEEALQKLEHVRVDLAVVDIMMPKLNGLELIKKIRQKPGFARLPILVISNEPADAEIAKISGPIGYAKKPLSPDPVLHEVRRLMSAV